MTRRSWWWALSLLALAGQLALGDDAGKPSVTYCNQIARFLQNRCQVCHHSGTEAPFALLTYEDARNWGETAMEAMQQRRMPPWFADPKVGHFANERALAAEEIKTFTDWVTAGMPKGNEQELPKPLEFARGWKIGKPDVVLQMDREFQVPATGIVDYKYFRVPNDFQEDKWVQAIELRAGNPRAVHHILMLVNPPDTAEGRELRDELRSDRRALGFFAALAPGSTPTVFPKGFGKRIPKGSTIVFQMHYTPTGTAAADRSSVGLIFATEPVHTEVRTRGVFNRLFAIPPGAENHEVKSSYQFPEETTVLSFMPHMHLRGKSFYYQVRYPDGNVMDLLSVPRYDFNWQLTYELAKPLVLPAGSRILCTAYYDNSNDNPANPDPDKWVKWGDQTWDEMMIGYIHYYVNGEK